MAAKEMSEIRVIRVVRVLPGHRVEVVVPEFREGDLVNVVVEECGNRLQSRESVLTLLDSLPDGPRAFATWEEYEHHLRQEKDAWVH
jgi:hypothetical protein